MPGPVNRTKQGEAIVLSAMGMDGKVKGHDSSRREGRTSEGLRGSVSKEVTFEQTSKEPEGASPIGNWQNRTCPGIWNLCRGSEAGTVSPSQGSARRPVGWRGVSQGEEARGPPDPRDLSSPGVSQHLRCTHGEEKARTSRDLPKAQAIHPNLVLKPQLEALCGSLQQVPLTP